jgi:anti-sigma regulatory factor (Ser/Thr protein kinase)
MATSLTLNLPSDSSAPRAARHAITRQLGVQLSPDRLSELNLVVTELVSNAVLHGRGEVVLRLQLEGDIVQGEVIDQGGGFEREIRVRGPQDVGGRGLMLVEQLTNRWGVHEGTTHVWFELAAASNAPAGDLKPRLGEGERPDALD